MEGIALQINPDSHIIHLMHGLPSFNLFYAARTMEAISYMPLGFHVCVVDPGVGTDRKAIIIEAGRGDFLIGPDNGVLLPATRFLEGIKRAFEITNKKYMRQPVSPIFHGRDIFVTAAAYLSKGTKIEEFGKELRPENLVEAPYEEATLEGRSFKAKIISINKFGSIHVNIMHEAWDNFNLKIKDTVNLDFPNNSIKVPFVRTFGDVKNGEALIMKDDFGRVEVSLNLDSFAKKYNVKIGGEVEIKK